MQANNTSNGRAFFKSLLLVGILALIFNVNAQDRDSEWGDPVQFNGLEYVPVKLKGSSRFWLDRNLGAEQVCKDSKDELCYGDLYQWGRNADGHQLRDSETTTALAGQITTTTGKFFIKPRSTNSDWTHIDKKGEARESSWMNGAANDICPDGYSVPTMDEFKTLIRETGISYNNIVENDLSIPFAGYRYEGSGDISWKGASINFWTRSAFWSDWGVAPWAETVYINKAFLSYRRVNRSQGMSVRCIQDAQT